MTFTRRQAGIWTRCSKAGLEVRAQVMDALFRRMANDPSLFLLTADMGINLVEPFAETYPDRFLNVGIAEQNLVGVGSGLANLGFRPFLYTISNFAVTRCLEQIRNDIVLHAYPITLLGTSTGYDNAPLGPTHHILDDWGTLRSIPGIDIYCPSSTANAGWIFERVLRNERPAYVRIPKGSPSEPSSTGPQVLLPGVTSEILLLTYGSLVKGCIEVQENDDRVSVMVFNQLSPLDHKELAGVFSSYDLLVVVEDQFPENGLYSSVCRIVAEHQLRGQVRSHSPVDYTFEVGTSREYYDQKNLCDSDGISRRLT